MWKQIIKSITGGGGSSQRRVLNRSSDFMLRGMETIRSEQTGEIYLLVPLKDAPGLLNEENAQKVDQIQAILNKQNGDMNALLKYCEDWAVTFNKLEKEVKVLKTQVKDLMDAGANGGDAGAAGK